MRPVKVCKSSARLGQTLLPRPGRGEEAFSGSCLRLWFESSGADWGRISLLLARNCTTDKRARLKNPARKTKDCCNILARHGPEPGRGHDAAGRMWRIFNLRAPHLAPIPREARLSCLIFRLVWNCVAHCLASNSLWWLARVASLDKKQNHTPTVMRAADPEKLVTR